MSTKQRYLSAILRLESIQAGIDYKVIFNGYDRRKGAKQSTRACKALYNLIDQYNKL